jgi:signal transduction histidine kinase/ligand-binding sensor domain-containing protein/DNA-binding response OmpR family regulator
MPQQQPTTDTLCRIILFTVLFLSSELIGAEYNISVLTNEDGLSNSSITTIFQDHDGLMWFGTWDGLNRYNGREFDVFKPDPSDKNTICNNIIRQIVEESPTVLWIATDRGLNRYDRQSRRFDAFFVNNNSQPIYAEKSFHIARNSVGDLFVNVNDLGLFYFDRQKNDFVRLEPDDISMTGLNKTRSDDISMIGLIKMFFDRDDHLWLLGKDRQLHKLILKKGTTHPVIIRASVFKPINDIVNAFHTEAGTIWIQTASEQLYAYHIAEGDMIEHRIALPPATHINDIISDDRRLLLGTDNGLFRYTPFDRQLKSMLPSVPVHSLLAGTQDILWVGTDNFGVMMLAPLRHKFNNYSSQNIRGFNGGAIRAFYEDDDGYLWVGTKGNGVYKIQKDGAGKMSTSAHYTVENGLLSNAVFTIRKGSGNECWIGSDGHGLNYIDPSSNRIETLVIPPSVHPVNISSVYAILVTGENTLWIGTSGQGICRLEIDKTTKPYSVRQAKQYLYDKNDPNALSNNIVYAIVQAGDSALWLGTRGGGINLFHIGRETFSHLRFAADDPNSLSCDDVICLRKDRTGHLWAGTSIGLNKLCAYDGTNAVFRRYTEKNGLPNNTVHGIEEDALGHIWISTNKGIVKLVETGDDVKLMAYYKRDGLQNNEFSDGAAYADEEENLYFGGISGFNVFNPQQIKQHTYRPPFVISSFKIFNRETNINERITVTKGSEWLKLRHDENFISFGFQAVDYINNGNCEYRYMLSGFDSDWVSNGHLGVATYTNIKPGRYTLTVCYTNSDKAWTDQPFELRILILPPYWKTTTASVIYLTVILAAIAFGYHRVRKRLEYNRKLLIERLERKEQEHIHEAKLRFFTNIAHEFYTPITLIYGPCEKILEQSAENDTVTKYVNIILSNARRMKRLITELMEFRRIDTGHIKIKPEKLNISALIDGINANFAEIAEKNHICLTTEKPEEELFWITDDDALEKILFNIVSNAFKYTPKNGSITVSITVPTDDIVRFEITNSGKGIGPEQIGQIFDRFRILDNLENQIEAPNAGRNGIGLAVTQSLVNLLKGTIKVESQVDRYTRFIIELPPLTLSSESSTGDSPTPATVPQTVIPVQLPAGENGEPLILIVDDEKDIRELLKDTLHKKFAHIIEAANGLEALRLMKTKRPNLIICDIMMPEMDGIAFARDLKTNVFTSHLPIIFLSAKDTVEDRMQALESGSDVYITKPFRPKHVLAAAENILIKHKLIREYYHSSANSYQLLENGNLIHQQDRAFLLKVIRYVETNMEEDDLSLETISHEMGIGKMSFYRKIKALLDQTPVEFIKRIKLNQATRLLVGTNLTVMEIMYRTGFNNKAYFYKEFVRLYGSTPKEYREKHSLSTGE